MAAALEHVHRLTVADYLRLAADDPHGDWDRTELIEGVIYDVSPESALHASAVRHLFLALMRALPEHEVFNSGSVVIGPDSLWDPDVYVLSPATPRDGTYWAATDVELVAEVPLTTRTTDLGAKAKGYAAAGIPQYWVLAPRPGGSLLRHRQPVGTGYEVVERFELPGGYTDLDVTALLA
jgi:Uma2 family endonuclease